MDMTRFEHICGTTALRTLLDGGRVYEIVSGNYLVAEYYVRDGILFLDNDQCSELKSHEEINEILENQDLFVRVHKKVLRT